MKKFPTILLDSSVLAKWIFLDENNGIADDIKTKYSLGQLSIAVPVLLFYEINNLLESAVRSRRIEHDDAL